MEDQIKELEEQSLSLEMSTVEMKSLIDSATEYTMRYISGLEDVKMYEDDPSSLRLLEENPFLENGIGLERSMRLYEDGVNTTGINPAAPGHLGYIPGGGIFSSSVADFLAAMSNKFSGLYFSGPGTVKAENQCIRWSADIIGYPSTALGNITSGGSIANLIAITTAREDKGITPEKIRTSVIYYSQQTHHCVQKSVRIAGLGLCQMREIALDKFYRMDPTALAAQIKEDVAMGLTPFLIVASCGSTDTGAVDPFNLIADIAEQYNAWLHVDGAYGGYFALVDEMKPLFAGIERSDSVVLDPHKTLFLPYGIGLVLVRNGKALFDTFHYTANYLQDVINSDTEASPADLSPELSRHFRGLRMWLPLHLHGIAPFRASLREKHLLTLYFYDKVKELGFEVGPLPQLSVAIYRFIPSHGDPNEYNAQLMDRIKNDGRLFVSSTTINGTFWLRIAIVSFRTHRRHIDRFLNILKEFTSE